MFKPGAKDVPRFGRISAVKLDRQICGDTFCAQRNTRGACAARTIQNRKENANQLLAREVRDALVSDAGLWITRRSIDFQAFIRTGVEAHFS